jgi:hypothetical protein
MICTKGTYMGSCTVLSIKFIYSVLVVMSFIEIRESQFCFDEGARGSNI